LPEPGGNYGTAFEINSEVEGLGAVGMEFVAVKCGAHAREHQQNRNADEDAALAKPVDVYLIK
jgi:hypothetical protein